MVNRSASIPTACATVARAWTTRSSLREGRSVLRDVIPQQHERREVGEGLGDVSAVVRELARCEQLERADRGGTGPERERMHGGDPLRREQGGETGPASLQVRRRDTHRAAGAQALDAGALILLDLEEVRELRRRTR